MVRLLLLIYSTLWPHSTIIFFFFNDTATTEIYTLSLHDALPIFSQLPVGSSRSSTRSSPSRRTASKTPPRLLSRRQPISADRKSTRLNSSHVRISYAVFCLKKKKTAPVPL